jgi:hypothetical protein
MLLEQHLLEIRERVAVERERGLRLALEHQEWGGFHRATLGTPGAIEKARRLG